MGFVLGVGGAFAFYLHITHQNIAYTFNQVDTEINPRARTHVFGFYDAAVQVPIPRDVDFASNTWEQLTLWKSFARYYCDYVKTDAGYLTEIIGSTTYPLTNVICGGRLMDEWKVEANREEEGNYLARKAALMTIEGIPIEEVRAWVSSNHCRVDPAKATLLDYAEHPEKTWR